MRWRGCGVVTDIRHATVLITGGASGIGALMGERFLRAGAARLLVWDIDSAALSRTIDRLRAQGHEAEGRPIDITDLLQLQSAIADLSARAIDIDILVNNAGIVIGKAFASHTHEEIDRTLRVNTAAPMHLTRALLPSMLRRGRGHVVNIASAAALVPNPGMSAYCASKSAMVGWSETLRLEMERGGTPVRVTTVMPYYIDTGMFEGVRSPLLPILEPESVADRVVAGVRTDAITLRLPRIVNALPLVRGLLPTRWFDKVVGDWMGVYESMRTFKGR